MKDMMNRQLFCRLQLLIIGMLCGCVVVFGNTGDTFVYKGIQYEITKEDIDAGNFEVSAVYYDTICVIVPDSIFYNGNRYVVTNVPNGYNRKTCGLERYSKIDLSQAQHIYTLHYQRSAQIAIDTLILPPHLRYFPTSFCTTEVSSLYSECLEDFQDLLPGIHCIVSTGVEDIPVGVSLCTSVKEIDLSSYSSTSLLHVQQFTGNSFLERCVLPNTIRSFEDIAFQACFRLRELSIPTDLESIGSHCFDEIRMDTLRLGSKVKNISTIFACGWYYLRHVEVASDNPYFTADNGVMFTKGKRTLFHYPYGRVDDCYYMPLQTDTIGEYAFCLSLFASVTNIEWFENLHPDSVNLTTLVCNPALKAVGRGAFKGASIRYVANFDKTEVVHIPIDCFAESFIQTISLPTALKSIGSGAFGKARCLTTLDFRTPYLSSIGGYAFAECIRLQSLDFLSCNSLTTLSEGLCEGDSALCYLALPRNVDSIAPNAFKGCVSLKQIMCPALVPVPIDASVFDGVDKSHCQLVVPTRSVSLYQTADIWKEFDIVGDNCFYVETNVANEAAGYVTGSGSYIYGEEAMIQAIANEGYEFVSWSDGNTDNPRMLRVTQDSVFEALFHPVGSETYILTVVVNEPEMGKVIGGGEYAAGTLVTLTAIPYAGYRFVKWSFYNILDETLSYVMPANDTTLTAEFEQKDTALEQMESTTDMPRKIIQNGQLYIIGDDKRKYFVTGIVAE